MDVEADPGDTTVNITSLVPRNSWSHTIVPHDQLSNHVGAVGAQGRDNEHGLGGPEGFPEEGTPSES